MTAVSLGLPEVAPPREPRAVHDARVHAMHDGDVASVHSWELVTAVDGPGTRMTLFLAGCPMRCRYCQNPDTWRERDGTPTRFDEVWQRVLHYEPVFRATGGGLTVSGGEPLQQAPFVERLFAACAERGIHTALDTSGLLGRHASEALLDATSLVLLDVKSGLADTYRAVTGRELLPTVDFGDRLAARGTPVWVRFVLVPGLTDAVDNVDAVAEVVARWSNVERVEVLPFHQLGESKWAELGLDYSLHGVRAPDAALLDRVRGQFAARGLSVF